MVDNYISGWVVYDNKPERELDELYVKCVCGKPWSEHGSTGQCHIKSKRYSPKRSK